MTKLLTPHVSSSHTLHTLTDVADVAGVTRQTLYNWLAAEPPVVQYTWEVSGTPVFTNEELEEVKRIAAARREAKDALRLHR